jgi:hypothetical protein
VYLWRRFDDGRRVGSGLDRVAQPIDLNQNGRTATQSTAASDVNRMNRGYARSTGAQSVRD